MKLLTNIAIIGSLSLGGAAAAETGMGLVVDITDKTNFAGKVRRIDLKDGKVVYTSPGWGNNIRNGRYSPDGSKLVTVNMSKQVEIRDLSGKVLQTFTTFEGKDAYVSWTNSGIWVGGIGKLVRYDEQGTIKETLTLKAGGSGATATTAADAAETKVKTVSHNDKTAGGRPKFAVTVLLDQKDSQNRVPVVKIGDGCSVGPSPDGSRVTRNLWETSKKHQTMKIHARTGAEQKYLYLYDILPYSNSNPTDSIDGYTWNRQTWSSNHKEIILIPAGRCYPQMNVHDSRCSTMPWIYNMATKKAFCLHTDPEKKSTWWYIHDFHSGKIGPQDECTTAGQCDDSKPCTDDSCSGGKCQHTPVADCCSAASQCDDGKPCTKDSCSANKCTHADIAGCCTSAGECGDGDPCTKDSCSANTCQHAPISGCCKAAADCDDGNACTKDSCSANACQHASISGCCKTNADCDDDNACTSDSCKKATGACNNAAMAGCCLLDGDCDDGLPCTADACVGNACTASPIASCCKVDADCDDGDACTSERCAGTACVSEPITACCSSDADCDDADDCTTDLCGATNRCDNKLLPDCGNIPKITISRPAGGETWRVGTTETIEWSTTNVEEVVVYLSTDRGGTWSTIGRVDTTGPDWGRLSWQIPPDALSDEAVIRVEGYFGESPVQSGFFAVTATAAPIGDTATGTPLRGATLRGGCSVGDAVGGAPGADRWPAVLLVLVVVLGALPWGRRRFRR